MVSDPKTFRLALANVSVASRKARAFLSDKRLTQAEKLILSAFLDLRDYRNEEIIRTLGKLRCENAFVESQRLYCLGCAYNNLTDYPLARDALAAAVTLNTLPEGAPQKLRSLQSLFTVLDNLGDGDGLRSVLRELELVATEEASSQVIVALAHFRYRVFSGDFAAALADLAALEARAPSMSEHQVVGFLFDLLDLYVGLDDLPRVEQVLERFKDYRKFKHGPIIQYYRTLLECLRTQGPLYLYPQALQEFPQIYAEVRVLMSAQDGNSADVRAAWDELRKLAPTQYGPSVGELRKASLFGLTLTRFLSPVVKPRAFSGAGPKVEQLLHLLETGAPVTKEELYRQLWGEAPQNKAALNRLAKLVLEARSRYAVEIKSVKSAYVLVRRQAS